MKDAKGHGSNAHNSGIEAVVPGKSYAEHKAHNEKLEAISRETSVALDKFPRGPMGLTPDHIKGTSEYQLARAAASKAFSALRDHNAFMVKNFKTEMKVDRDARRAGRIVK